MNRTKLDLSNARKSGSVNYIKIRDFLWDGQYATQRKMVELLASDPVFSRDKRLFQQRTDRFADGLAMMNRLCELRDIHHWDDQQFSLANRLIDENIPLTLHLVAFQPVILSQGSPEQVQDLGERAKKLAIIGAYAQTELGHGSEVSRLETTATYLPETEEFEIHSPTLTSTKWWVGGLAKTATHAVVQAQLILPGGKSKGPHLFIVQLRSLEDHSIREGITLGDIGPKAFNAFSALDNGFARFNHVRIPRSAMLSKFAQVSKEGKYVQPPHAKLGYGGMLYIRSNMISGCGWNLAKGITIAIRYCTVRRQGGAQGKSEERQVITFPSVYARLLPILSQSYVFILLGRSMLTLFQSMSSKLSTGDTSLLASTHAVSSGLKTLVTRRTADALATARAALGGHGFSAFAGTGRIWADHVPTMTYEGDNYVLDGQVVRAAVKAYNSVVKNGSTKGGFGVPFTAQYLTRLETTRHFPLQDCDWMDPMVGLEVLEWRAALMVQSFADSMAKEVLDSGGEHRLSFAVTDAFIVRKVTDIMSELPEKMAIKDGRQVVSDLLHLYILTTVESSLADVLSLSLVDPSCVQHLRGCISSLYVKILPEAVYLSDAFGFSDWELDSALGVYDGDVYEQLWKRAQEEPLNSLSDTGEIYQKHIAPILRRGAAKL